MPGAPSRSRRIMPAATPAFLGDRSVTCGMPVTAMRSILGTASGKVIRITN